MERQTDEGGMRVSLCYWVYKKDSKLSDKEETHEKLYSSGFSYPSVIPFSLLLPSPQLNHQL